MINNNFILQQILTLILILTLIPIQIMGKLNSHFMMINYK
jgi:hypothetical protein